MRRFKKQYVLNPIRSTAKYEEEATLCRKYGLKNKKQLGIARKLLIKYRALMKNRFPAVVQPAVTKLHDLGLISAPSVDCLLELTIESFLKRRLQCFLSRTMSISPRAARQLITHGHVFVDNVRKRFPGYLLRTVNETKIEVKGVIL
jgi:small subunit ribosomal protein S4